MGQSDAFFKPKAKNKQVSYAQSKSKFGLAYFIIYFYVCAQEFFTFSWKILNGVETLCVAAYSEYQPLTGFELTF